MLNLQKIGKIINFLKPVGLQLALLELKMIMAEALGCLHPAN